MKQRSKDRPRPIKPNVISPPQNWRDRLVANFGLILFFVAACAICIGYTLYTGQIWEDSLIALRQCENFVNGQGLTYNIGERVQGFSSPINVLVLSACRFITRQSSYLAAFWIYRCLTIPAFAMGGVLVIQAINRTPPRWTPAAWFFGTVYLFDVKNVAFSTNGMETAFMLLLVGWAVYLLSRAAPEQWLVRGLCWGGLMWTRTDGCVYIAAFALAEWIFLANSRRATFVSLVKSAAICFAIYLPWLIFAWSYYGNPIPHTIVAKAAAEQGTWARLLSIVDAFPGSLIYRASQVFCPMYGEQPHWLGHEVLSRVLILLTKFVGVVGLLYFIYPAADRFGRAVSLCFAILILYTAYMPYAFPWYLPPIGILGTTAFARAGSAFANAAVGTAAASATLSSSVSWRRYAVGITFTIVALGTIVLFFPAAFEQRVQQAEIETGNRAEIGKWLKENASPTDSVYLEPLGYIGYFSGLHMDDFPGLVSPKVVKIRQNLRLDPPLVPAARLLVIPELKPDWIVLRFSEVDTLNQLSIADEFKRQYVFWRDFNVSDRLKKYSRIAGRFSLEYDAAYAVFKRNSSAN